MTNLPPFSTQIQIEETTFRAAVSQSVMQRIGGAINYILTFAAVNGQTSGSTGYWYDQSAILVQVPALTATLTSIGRPVLISIQPDGGAADNSSITIENVATLNITQTVELYVYRNGVSIANFEYLSGNNLLSTVPNPFFIDTPLGGTWTYTVYINTQSNYAKLTFNQMALSVYQL